jgi:hypothetical protein
MMEKRAVGGARKVGHWVMTAAAAVGGSIVGRELVAWLSTNGLLVSATSGGVIGLLAGCIPWTMARRRGRRALAFTSLLTCALSGAAFGILLAGPVAGVFVLAIRRARSGRTHDHAAEQHTVDRPVTGQGSPRYSWKCPACQRQVPLSVSVCRCGHVTSIASSPPQPSPRRLVTIAPRVAVVWIVGISLSALMAYVGMIAPSQLRRTYQQEWDLNANQARLLLVAHNNRLYVPTGVQSQQLTERATWLQARLSFLSDQLEHDPAARTHPIWGIGGPILLLGFCAWFSLGPKASSDTPAGHRPSTDGGLATHPIGKA